MTLGEQRRKALELLAPPPSRHDHSGVVRPLSYSRPHQAGTTTPMAASRASRGSASSKPSIISVLAERHARHLAERAQTLQDARKPMHTDPSTIWVICYQRTTQERDRRLVKVASHGFPNRHHLRIVCDGSYQDRSRHAVSFQMPCAPPRNAADGRDRYPQTLEQEGRARRLMLL
jgi:hypothetical protein